VTKALKGVIRMIAKIDKNAVLEKLGEFCIELMHQESYQELRKMIDTFAEDEQAVEQYESFTRLNRYLQQKEEQQEEISQEELDRYEQDERGLYDNAAIRQFLYAQREFNSLLQTIDQYVAKAIELDRLPEPSELKKNGGCGCGGNCGCGGGH
jgi:cell fate (sporulation/competence/biofilm development) regulator YlbF (YheA/YmcA/DUF963 family)